MPLTVINTFNGLIRRYGRPYQAWYVGVTSDPVERLFTGHTVNRLNGIYLVAKTNSHFGARAVEKYFLTLGTDGGGGGDLNCRYVYIYLKTPFTKP